MSNYKKSAEGMFTTQDGNRMFLSSEFAYDLIKFDDYKIDKLAYPGICALAYTNIDNIPVSEIEITESGKKRFDADLITNHVKANDPNLFFSLLNLIDKAGKIPFGNESRIELFISEQQINLAIEWAKKYGIPFESDITKSIDCDLDIPTQGTDNNLGIPANKGNSIPYERRNDFKYICEHAAPPLIPNAPVNNTVKKEGFRIGTFYSYLNDLKHNFETVKEMQHLSAGQSEYADYFTIMLSKTKFTCEIKYENGFKYYIKAANVFDAAQYQLIMLMANPSGENIRRCACCGEWYQPTRKNNNYCPLCSPQKAYKRRQSSNTKEVSDNGNNPEAGK
ncbi:hypothetical protein CAFE_20500 [Caprobacter fermentans]|uniref:Uncharacterized protein n=1 Tax=Caproicibacter fermentans TaxID=2576756 RepID=A0A6N8I0U9_9FIRM|nr:hypothetical protein [Caproicibacter fermentans]MVB11337.1 hypothetical protein [Caproicibacter fermentans]